MSFKDELKSYALEIGIDDLKVTSAQPFFKLKRFMQKLKKKNYLSKFVKDDLDLITNPKKVLEDAKSVIVCAISYKIDDKYIDLNQKGLRGKLSRFALGKDYHQVLGNKLEKLANCLREEGFRAVKFVDTGPTVDRALAKRAGIGWQGKNCSIIHPQYGSWIFIGGLISDLDLESDGSIESNCGECRRCIESCPTGALKADYTLDSRKCLGYISLSKGYIAAEYRKKLRTRLWGCDSCQEVCPANKEAKSGNHPHFKPEDLAPYPYLPPLLKLSNKEYKEKFGSTAMNWRGKRPIQRNAAIIMGNLNDKIAIPHLLDGLEDPKPIVRAHSAWALAEIGDKSVKSKLKLLLKKERDKEVKKEYEFAVEKLMG